jgi:hypothetical protein
MRLAIGLLIAAMFGVGCGHEQTTGSAQNGFATPTGYASATNPRVVDPDRAARGPSRTLRPPPSELPPSPPSPPPVEPGGTVVP